MTSSTAFLLATVNIVALVKPLRKIDVMYNKTHFVFHIEQCSKYVLVILLKSCVKSIERTRLSCIMLRD